MINFEFELIRLNNENVISTSGKIKKYNIIENLTSVIGDENNAKKIATDEEKTLKYSAEEGYSLPDTIEIDGADGQDTWDSTEGTVTISNPTKDVTVTVTGWECFVKGTMITLANGSKKKVETIDLNDEILSWDFVEGKYVGTKIATVTAHEVKDYDVLKLNFEDNSTLEIIGKHGLFDCSIRKFVNIDENNVKEYIGHEFIKCTENSLSQVKLVSYETYNKNVQAYSIIAAKYLSAIANDLLSLDAALYFLFPFEINSDMKFDKEAYQKDVDTIGLYTYEEFKELAPFISESQFLAGAGQYIKIALAKGIIDIEEIKEYTSLVLSDQKLLTK